MNQQKRKEILSRLFWDYSFTTSEVEQMISNPSSGQEQEKVFLRLLTSCNWYTLLQILTAEELKQALSDRVLNKIHIGTLREKYIYARQFLS